MVIMIIFIIMSLILAIGTLIYIYNKKENLHKSGKIIEKDIKNKKKELTDILQFKIKDNIICLGNRYSCVIRLGNIDYNMLSVHEQDSIENILVQTALAVDYPIQFFSTTEYIDTSKVISLIKQNHTRNKNVQDYKNFLIEYLQNLMENRAISVVKNYAVISYDGLYEDAVEELNRNATAFNGNLLRAKIVCETLTEDELYDLIYRELNKNSALKISPLKEGGKNLYVGKIQKAKQGN